MERRMIPRGSSRMAGCMYYHCRNNELQMAKQACIQRFYLYDHCGRLDFISSKQIHTIAITNGFLKRNISNQGLNADAMIVK